MKKLILVLAFLVSFGACFAQLTTTKINRAFTSAASLDELEAVGGIHYGDSIAVALGARSSVATAEKLGLRDCIVGVGSSLLSDFMLADCLPFKVLITGSGSGYLVNQVDLRFDALSAPSVHAELNKMFGRNIRKEGSLFVWKTKKFIIEYIKPNSYDGEGSVTIRPNSHI